MSSCLIVIEHRDGKIKSSNFSVVGFAKKYCDSFDFVVLSDNPEPLAEQLTQYGADKVCMIEDPLLDHYLAQPYTQGLQDFIENRDYDWIIAPSTTFGKDLMPRVAASIEAGMGSDIIGIDDSEGEILFKRPVWAGAAIALTEITTSQKVLTIRVSSFEAVEKDQNLKPSKIEGYELEYEIESGMNFEKMVENSSDRPELTDASVVISGGRGLRDKEGFDSMLNPIADLLDGAIGASRAAVDSNFCPNDLQVGQTGKIVAPDLYIGVGISGAIQHIAGMKDAKVIVAINRDEEAPIFEIADYGLVDDAFKAIPKLTELIKKDRS